MGDFRRFEGVAAIELHNMYFSFVNSRGLVYSLWILLLYSGIYLLQHNG
jgi:hypothetical protein